MALHYCKKCGRLVQNSWNEEILRCDCCNTITSPVPLEFLDGKVNVFFKDNDIKQQFIDKYIKTSPEFDSYLFDHREEILAKKSAEFDAAMAHGKALLEGKSGQVTCSHCGSANVRKIGFVSRAVSAELWGLGSKKIGKQWHCNSCGSDF